MVIKQRNTPWDGFLLKVVFPMLFSSGLGKQLLRWQVWHQDSSSSNEPIEADAAPNITDLVARMQARRVARPLPSTPLRHKRAA